MSDSFFDHVKLYSSMPSYITIWIHGTRTHDIFPPTYTNAESNKANKSSLYSPHGIHNMLSLDQDLHVVTIAQALHESNKSRYPKEHLYLFGWSGGFTPEARRVAGSFLYQELKKISLAYKTQYGACPPFIIIAHSHGGNVVLESMAVAETDTENDGIISIEQLILLACPVQEKTKPYLKSSFFKKIYSIHSHKDYFQILDMQGLHPVLAAFEHSFKSVSLLPLKNAWTGYNKSMKIFSERHFSPQSNLRQGCVEWQKQSVKWSLQDLCIVRPFLSDKKIEILQGHLKKYDQKQRGLMHVEFLFPTFMGHLGAIIDTLDTLQDDRDGDQLGKNIYI